MRVRMEEDFRAPSDKPHPANSNNQRALGLPKQLRQLGDIHRDPPCLVAHKQLGRDVRFTPKVDIGVGPRPNSDGFATLAAIRRASSFVSS